MDQEHLTAAIMALLRDLYQQDPGAFETEMGGADEYTDRRIEQAIEALLREHA